MKKNSTRQPPDWEKTLVNDENNKGLISKIYKQLNIKKKHSFKKWAEDLIDISPKKTYRWLTNT